MDERGGLISNSVGSSQILSRVFDLLAESTLRDIIVKLAFVAIVVFEVELERPEVFAFYFYDKRALFGAVKEVLGVCCSVRTF